MKSPQDVINFFDAVAELYESDAKVKLIPNTELRVGMQTMIPDKNHFETNVKLKKFFVTSPRFPDIAFDTDRGKVIYSPCGKTFVKLSD